MTWKSGLLLGLGAFAVTLAYQVSTRLSVEALNVAVGVLFGIAASVPVSLGLLVALTRERRAADDDPRDLEQSAPNPAPRTLPQPPVIVIAPPHGAYGQLQPPYAQQPWAGSAYANYAPPLADDVIEGRDWRIIGDDA